ncbi:MAG TPA: class I SAM-dependent methyltransferase [Solirubrobacteraceae bacterium]|nr:class I SAM-dependent methyltransferase [Solirubrobacteraceae bacterium]
MNGETLACLACPTCASELSPSAATDGGVAGHGALRCDRGHEFAVVDGIPRFTGGALTASASAASIQSSFGSEWTQLEYDTDRVWGQSLELRREIALRELDCEAADLEGKLVLDAGCGAGLLSYLLWEMGARVVAADITTSVNAAQRYLRSRGADGVDFVQADLLNPPFRAGSFDIVFSGGVLHHNPDTRAALDAIAPLVAPGGQIYAWLYGPTPGLAHRVRTLVRKVVVPLPPTAQRSLMRVWTAQSIARQQLRRRTGRARPDDGVTYREKLVTLLDHYTPRYRWEHTPEELSAWYRELGLAHVNTTEHTPVGFGVLARRPAAATARAGGQPVPARAATPNG